MDATPDAAPGATGRPRDFAVDEDFVASATGAVAIGLPGFALAGFAVTGCFRDTLSHSYYAPVLGEAFVGALFVIGALLLAYRPRATSDRVVLAVAGLSAFAVALLPTSGPGLEAGLVAGPGEAACRSRPFAGGGDDYALHPVAGALHFGAAGLLFACLALVVLRRFRAVDPLDRTDPSDPSSAILPIKRRRNRIYSAAGWTIVAVIALLAAHGLLGLGGAAWRALNATFWLEAMALMAFGAAWLTRGRVFATALLDHGEAPAGHGTRRRLMLGGSAVIALLGTALALA